MSSFHIGQRIVCINDNWDTGWLSPLDLQSYVPNQPKKGALYHVRSIHFDFAPNVFIRLAEIANPIPPRLFAEVAFISVCFRPVIERSTDICIFTKLLVPNPKELERA